MDDKSKKDSKIEGEGSYTGTREEFTTCYLLLLQYFQRTTQWRPQSP